MKADAQVRESLEEDAKEIEMKIKQAEKMLARLRNLNMKDMLLEEPEEERLGLGLQ